VAVVMGVGSCVVGGGCEVVAAWARTRHSDRWGAGAGGGAAAVASGWEAGGVAASGGWWSGGGGEKVVVNVEGKTRGGDEKGKLLVERRTTGSARLPVPVW
jgi:hypothetical protein